METRVFFNEILSLRLHGDARLRRTELQTYLHCRGHRRAHIYVLRVRRKTRCHRRQVIRIEWHVREPKTSFAVRRRRPREPADRVGNLYRRIRNCPSRWVLHHTLDRPRVTQLRVAEWREREQNHSQEHERECA